MMAKKMDLKSMFAHKEVGVEGVYTRTKVVGVRRCGSGKDVICSFGKRCDLQQNDRARPDRRVQRLFHMHLLIHIFQASENSAAVPSHVCSEIQGTLFEQSI